MAKIAFLPYQKKWITNPAQFAICEKSRRVGITYAEAYRVTRDLSTKNVKNNKVWFSSADLSASEEFIDYVGFFANYLNIASKYLGEVVIDKEDDVTAHRVRFSNGCECNAISSNPTRFRSKGGDVILDEFAHHRDQEKMFTAAKPSMMWGNRVRLISTHNGDDSYFNGLLKETRKGTEGSMKSWVPYKITIEDAIKEGLVDKVLGHKASKEEIAKYLDDAFSGMTQESIDEEFYCIPRSSSNSHLLPYELINPIERDNIIDDTLQSITGDMYVGMDIGRRKNYSVIWIFEKLGEILYTRKIIALKKVEYSEQRKILYDVLSHPCFRRCCIDATGIGNEFAENAQKAFGQFRVEPIMFTPKVKEDLASYTYLMVEGRKVVIPREKTIRDDFYSVRAITTKSGNVRYEAAVSELGSHADYFWGFSLGLEAARSYAGPLIITSGARRYVNTILQGY
ncbi:MAG: terminase family protein [Melioribacteraceae bacterium]|jgi:phage FluMu gp28-like protein|nr:terminase family protein [Melioribacteraceae bacterium]